MIENGDLLSFFGPSAGHLAAQVSLPTGICHPRRKNAHVLPGLARGGAWAHLELTNALVLTEFIVLSTLTIRDHVKMR